eukprot:tig00000219_g19437.t1
MLQRLARREGKDGGPRPFTAPEALPPLAAAPPPRSVSPPPIRALASRSSSHGVLRTSTPQPGTKSGTPMSRMRAKLAGAMDASHTLDGTKSAADLGGVPLYRLNLAKGNNTLQHSATEPRLLRPKTAPEAAAKGAASGSDEEQPSSPPPAAAAAWGEGSSQRSAKLRRPVMSAFTKEMNEIAGRALADLSASSEVEGKSVMAQLRKLQVRDGPGRGGAERGGAGLS